MSTAPTTAPKQSRAAQADLTLEQILDRQHELVLQREYVPLGKIDYIYVPRGGTLVKMDYRKDGPRLAFNPDTGDLLLLSAWNGLPNLATGEGTPCQSCVAVCGDCKGTGAKQCTLAGCGGSGQITTQFRACPDCLGGAGNKTKPDCATCNGRGEVVKPEKCRGCDDNGLAKCFPCGGSGKVSTGREKGQSDYYDQVANRFVSVPACKACSGKGRTAPTQPQDWRQFGWGQVNIGGKNMAALGPIQRIVWHTMDSNGKFQSCNVTPDRGGNLMVLLLESDQPGSKQYLVGGITEIK